MQTDARYENENRAAKSRSWPMLENVLSSVSIYLLQKLGAVSSYIFLQLIRTKYASSETVFLKTVTNYFNFFMDGTKNDWKEYLLN